jgi:hypothetical protein
MALEKLAPVRPVLDQLLANRAAPWHQRRPLARAVAEAIAQRKPYHWAQLLEWVFLKTSDLPRERRRRTKDMSGKIIDETPERTRAYEQARASGAQNGSMTPEQAELAERRAARTRRREEQRQRWLEESGFAAVIEKAEALLDDCPRAREEHHRAQASLGDLGAFIALAADTPEDAVLQKFARRAQDLAHSITRPPLLFENATALRALIATVTAADLEGVNGARNSNLTAAWRRQFQELVTPLPQPGHAAHCARAVKALMTEARDARAGRTA